MTTNNIDIFDLKVYRTSGELRRPMAELEMKEACQVMYIWRKHEPMLAGGALWAWAADQAPRDIDIFVKHSFWRRAHRKARKLYGPARGYRDDSPVEMYDLETTSLLRDSRRYTMYLRKSRAPVDLIVTNWSGREAIENFDYAHCQVGFAPRLQVTIGAEYYAKQLIKTLRLPLRRFEVIEKKLQSELWGRPWAVTRLLGVLCQLDQIYTEIEESAEEQRRSGL